MTEPRAGGKPAPDDPEWPHSEGADIELDKVLDRLRDLLKAKSSQLSRTRTASAYDVRHAFDEFMCGDRSPKFADAQKIISQALDENRRLERISYWMAVVLFLSGLVILIAGVAFGDSTARSGALFSGSIVEMLILMPFRVIVNSRRENIALNMLGIILDRVDDPQKAATLLLRFLAVFLGNVRFKGVE